MHRLASQVVPCMEEVQLINIVSSSSEVVPCMEVVQLIYIVKLEENMWRTHGRRVK